MEEDGVVGPTDQEDAAAAQATAPCATAPRAAALTPRESDETSIGTLGVVDAVVPWKGEACCPDLARLTMRQAGSRRTCACSAPDEPALTETGGGPRSEAAAGSSPTESPASWQHMAVSQALCGRRVRAIAWSHGLGTKRRLRPDCERRTTSTPPRIDAIPSRSHRTRRIHRLLPRIARFLPLDHIAPPKVCKLVALDSKKNNSISAMV